MRRVSSDQKEWSPDMQSRQPQMRTSLAGVKFSSYTGTRFSPPSKGTGYFQLKFTNSRNRPQLLELTRRLGRASKIYTRPVCTFSRGVELKQNLVTSPSTLFVISGMRPTMTGATF